MPMNNQKPTIFIASRVDHKTASGRFPLERDDYGPFVILPGDAKIYLSEHLIKPGKATGADFVYASPVNWSPPRKTG